jgi:hypothetical protein
MEERINMTAKRFTTNGYKIYDTFHDGMHWLVNEVEAEEIVAIMNNLDIKARERSKALSKLQKENEQLKKQLESEHTMLDNAILLERTRMGQNSLKQYKEAIQ